VIIGCDNLLPGLNRRFLRVVPSLFIPSAAFAFLRAALAARGLGTDLPPVLASCALFFGFSVGFVLVAVLAIVSVV
jgi:hypothetical protein